MGHFVEYGKPILKPKAKRSPNSEEQQIGGMYPTREQQH